MSIKSMSTYIHVGSSAGGIFRVKSRKRRGVLGSLLGSNLRSGGSSQFTSVTHAGLQL